MKGNRLQKHQEDLRKQVSAKAKKVIITVHYPNDRGTRQDGFFWEKIYTSEWLQKSKLLSEIVFLLSLADKYI